MAVKPPTRQGRSGHPRSPEVVERITATQRKNYSPVTGEGWYRRYQIREEMLRRWSDPKTRKNMIEGRHGK